MTSAISILHEMRRRADERIRHYKVVSFALLGLLLIDFIIILFKPIGILGVIGVFVCVGWITFSFIAMIEQKQQQQLIDDFYLSQGEKDENQTEI